MFWGILWGIVRYCEMLWNIVRDIVGYCERYCEIFWVIVRYFERYCETFWEMLWGIAMCSCMIANTVTVGIFVQLYVMFSIKCVQFGCSVSSLWVRFDVLLSNWLIGGVWSFVLLSDCLYLVLPILLPHILYDIFAVSFPVCFCLSNTLFLLNLAFLAVCSPMFLEHFSVYP